MKSDATKLASLSAVIEPDLAVIVKLDNQLSQLLEERRKSFFSNGGSDGLYFFWVVK